MEHIDLILLAACMAMLYWTTRKPNEPITLNEFITLVGNERAKPWLWWLLLFVIIWKL